MINKVTLIIYNYVFFFSAQGSVQKVHDKKKTNDGLLRLPVVSHSRWLADSYFKVIQHFNIKNIQNRAYKQRIRGDLSVEKFNEHEAT